LSGGAKGTFVPAPVPSQKQALEGIGRNRQRGQEKQLRKEMRNLDIKALSGGSGKSRPADPLNKPQIQEIRKAALAGKQAPVLGGRVKDQEKLRKLILGGQGRPSKAIAAKKAQRRERKKLSLPMQKKKGGGVIYI
jgi:hypothetical protein